MEGGNKTLSEGTLFGTPFVATESAGTIGFFELSHGISVPVRDPQQFAAALVEILSAPRGLGSAAARPAWRVVSASTSAAVAAAMTQVYQRAIDLSSRAARGGEAPDRTPAQPGG